jgi:hypothetical protein
MATTQDLAQLIIEETPRYEGAPNTTPTRLSTNVLYMPVQEAGLEPGPQFDSRGDEVRGISGQPPGLVDGYEVTGAINVRMYGNILPYLLTIAGWSGVRTAGSATMHDDINETTATGVNALDSTTVNVGDTTEFPASGTFILITSGPVTTAVTYSAKTSTSFTGCSTHPATTGGEAVHGHLPTNTSKWVFDKRAGTVAKTAQLTLAFADELQFLRGQGMGISTFSMGANGLWTSTLMGLVFARIADPNLTPSYDTLSIPHFRRGDLTLRWLAGGAEVTDFQMTFPNPLLRYSALGAQSFFPSSMEHGDEIIVPTGTIPKRVLDDADIDAVLAGTTFVAKARWSSSKVIGATTKPYQMAVKMPACQYTGADMPSMRNVRRFPASYPFKAAIDETLGYDCRIVIVNSVSAVETYV